VHDSNYSRFLIADNALFLRKQEVHNGFKQRYGDVESCLGFQYNFDDRIADLAHFSKDNFTLQKQLGRVYYIRNLHYLHTAFHLSVEGLIEPFFNNMRTVFESILKMYYISLFPDKAKEIQDDTINNSQKFTTNSLIQKLYVKETKEGCQRYLKELHKSAHSDYRRTLINTKFSVVGVSKQLKDLLVLSFYNIIAEFENQSQQPNIIDDTLINDTMFYLEKLSKLIVIKNNDIPAFFPDKTH